MMGVFLVPNSEWDFDDESQNTNNPQSGNGLRAQLERALTELKTLKTENAALTKQVRTATISSHVKDKGLNPKIAKLIPSDIEPTVEALDAWFEENADLFPATATSTEGQGEQPQSGVDEDPEQAAMATEMDRLANIANAGRVPGRVEDQMQKLLDPNLTQEKLMEMIRSAGGGVGAG